MELGPEDVSLLERCPHFRGWYIHTLDIQMNNVPGVEMVNPLQYLLHIIETLV